MRLLTYRFNAFLFTLAFVPALSAQVGTLGAVRFANLAPGVNAPFFAAGGTNRLAGSDYVAALYVAQAGTPNPEFLLAGIPQPFQDGTAAGYWTPADVPLAPVFPPGARVRLQVRFWKLGPNPSATFEQAEADGAEIGVSEIPSVTLNAEGSPTPMIGLQSASLVPILTLSRGGPFVATDSAITASGSQLRSLCGVDVGTNRWFRLTSPEDAIAVLNTGGSAIDTVMGAFTGSIVNLASLVELACNDDRMFGQTSSAVTFRAEADTLYLICIAGKGGVSGPVRLNYATGVALEIQRTGTDRGVDVSWSADGGSYQLESSPNPHLPDSWRPVIQSPDLFNSRYVLSLKATNHCDVFRLRALP